MKKVFYNSKNEKIRLQRGPLPLQMTKLEYAVPRFIAHRKNKALFGLRTGHISPLPQCVLVLIITT
jgi:hypothetical protein